MKSMWIALFTAGALLAQSSAEIEQRKLEDRKKLDAAKHAAEAAFVLNEEVIGTAGGRIETRKIVMGSQTMEFVSAMNVGATLKGAPYSAEAVTETTQTLYDGNRITQKSSAQQYRDSEGRERREEGSAMNMVFISDPVAKASYTLHPATMTAEKSSPLEKTFFFAPTAGKAVFTAAVPATMGTAGPGMVTEFRNSSGGTPQEEDLGTRLFDGVQAQGTRITSTIAAGEIGNDRPIEIVDERWYSPELQLTVMTRHADPRAGETVYKLTNIQRLEQVRSLFEVPRSYSIVEPANNVLKSRVTILKKEE
ncbi:MAG: hypothetical protein ABI811_06675 [Acidobacteriota bacterium]